MPVLTLLTPTQALNQHHHPLLCPTGANCRSCWTVTPTFSCLMLVAALWGNGEGGSRAPRHHKVAVLARLLQ